jgi:hypothetical protein
MEKAPVPLRRGPAPAEHVHVGVGRGRPTRCIGRSLSPAHRHISSAFEDVPVGCTRRGRGPPDETVAFVAGVGDDLTPSATRDRHSRTSQRLKGNSQCCPERPDAGATAAVGRIWCLIDDTRRMARLTDAGTGRPTATF